MEWSKNKYEKNAKLTKLFYQNIVPCEDNLWVHLLKRNKLFNLHRVILEDKLICLKKKPGSQQISDLVNSDLRSEREKKCGHTKELPRNSQSIFFIEYFFLVRTSLCAMHVRAMCIYVCVIKWPLISSVDCVISAQFIYLHIVFECWVHTLHSCSCCEFVVFFLFLGLIWLYAKRTFLFYSINGVFSSL